MAPDSTYTYHGIASDSTYTYHGIAPDSTYTYHGIAPDSTYTYHGIAPDSTNILQTAARKWRRRRRSWGGWRTRTCRSWIWRNLSGTCSRTVSIEWLKASVNYAAWRNAEQYRRVNSEALRICENISSSFWCQITWRSLRYWMWGFEVSQNNLRIINTLLAWRLARPNPC